MTTLEVLRKARGYIERGWCQGAEARDVEGNACPLDDDGAREWCALGSMLAASGGTGHAPAVGAIRNALIHRGSHRTIASWNDTEDRTQAEVLALFDEAIAAEYAAHERSE